MIKQKHGLENAFSNPRIFAETKRVVTKDEFEKKLSRVNQLMDELIFPFMLSGMSYRQAEEEVFRMAKRTRSSKEGEDPFE